MEEINRVLFVCVHNSARSQMSEALLTSMGGERFEVESAGIEPGTLSPLAVEAMADMGIDISKNHTQSVFDLYKAGRLYTYVITVCDAASAQRCHIFPGVAENIHWSFDDPSSFTGSHEEKLKKTIEVRDEIKQEIEKLIAEAM
ncbi:MAG: arsenate reductase ArsC [Deltaproteobacteria bacterium]|nr:arsenate reductase ArsC [Deltaproteobacteria bacterium]